ncbi:MAG: ROK family protein [Nitriliruptorales bacterium]|nr:ROK family protein [Nitriliruptorales bacterium]
MSGQAVSVGIDVGGTKLVAATVAEDGAVLDRARVESPRGDADRMLDVLVQLVDDVGGHGLPVGVGIAGIVSPDGTLRYGPNLDLEQVPLARLLGERLGTSIVVKNDATVALYGEYAAGAGRGARDLLMLTLGTGVGGAFMVDGAVVDGAHGFAGELGHIIIVDDGRPCPCGNLGCLEAYASGTAVERRVVQRLGDDAVETSLRELSRDELVGKDVTTAAGDGDAFAQEVLTEAGRWLGVGLASLVNVLDPARILIGGGFATGSADWVLPAAQQAMQRRLLGAAHRPSLEPILAELGDDAGMIGAARLAADGGG